MTPNAAASLRTDAFLRLTPAPSTQPDLDAAMLRAYTTARSLDYGCSMDDVGKLQTRVAAGYGWVDILDLLAADNLQRAGHCVAAGNAGSAGGFYLHAAACLRLAQAAQEDDPQARLRTYLRQREAFEQAMAVLDRETLGFDVVHRGAAHRAWYFPQRSANAPCVVVWGGADGWCEAFHSSVGFFLERGLAVCLVEIPGQGLARLRDGSYLDARFTDMVSLTLDALAVKGASERYGVVGHSLGGAMALAAAAADDRIVACCTNGGSVQLASGLGKYPRVLARVARMTGVEPEATLELIGAMQIETAARTMRAQLLCLHGGKDVLVDDAEAIRLVELRGRGDATYERWADGAHCVYNHAYERNCVMTDWFASVLHGA